MNAPATGEAIALHWERPEAFSENVKSRNRDHLPRSLYFCLVLPSIYTAEGIFICGADFSTSRVSVLSTVTPDIDLLSLPGKVYAKCLQKGCRKIFESCITPAVVFV